MSELNVVIQPEQSLDITTSESLRIKITDTLQRNVDSILIDCQHVTFMDSSGLSAMVMALKHAKEANVRLALCAVGEQAGMLFSLTGMDQIFEIFEDRAAFEKTIAQLA